MNEEKFRPHCFKYTWISREYSAVFWALPNRLRASQISFKKRREFSTIYNAGIVTYIRSTFAYYFFHIQISVGYFSRNLQIWIPLENILVGLIFVFFLFLLRALWSPILTEFLLRIDVLGKTVLCIFNWKLSMQNNS